MIEDILPKAKTIFEEILKKDSDVSLFALIKLETANAWDFVLAGKNLNPSADNLKWVSDILKKELTANELAIISRIVLLPSENLFVKGMNSLIEVPKESNYMKVVNLQMTNALIQEGYVVYSIAPKN